jgi:hypothetical protein
LAMTAAYGLPAGVKGSLRRFAPLTPSDSRNTGGPTHSNFKRGFFHSIKPFFSA